MASKVTVLRRSRVAKREKGKERADTFDLTDIDLRDRISKEWADLRLSGMKLALSSKRNGENDDEKGSKIVMQPYQEVVSRVLLQSRGILLYHGLGSGKTLAAIWAAEQFANRHKYVLLPSSLIANFIGELKKLPKFERQSDETERQRDNRVAAEYTFYSVNAPNFAAQVEQGRERGTSRLRRKQIVVDQNDQSYGFFAEHVAATDGSRFKTAIIIIDEVHNFVNNVISANAKNAERVYRMIMDAPNAKVIAMSGTPISADPFSSAILFNMLRGKMKVETAKGTKEYLLFPNKQSEFAKYFLSPDRKTMINRNIYGERINGLVSYYAGVQDKAIVAEVLPPRIYLLPMGQYQWEVYVAARLKEIQEEKLTKFQTTAFKEVLNKKPSRETMTTYKIKTRQIGNFALPEGFDKPKESHLFPAFVASLPDEDLRAKKLGRYSVKYEKLLQVLAETTGNTLIYSEFVSVEGAAVLARVLTLAGYTHFGSPVEQKKGIQPSFAILSGDVASKERSRILAAFNGSDNIRGGVLRILLISVVAAEGVTTRNVRHVHIMEPYWYESRSQQVIGRAVRLYVHADLPLNERTVEVHKYLAVPPRGTSPIKAIGDTADESTDQWVARVAISRQLLIDQFLDVMRKNAIDCELNLSVNKRVVGECSRCSRPHRPGDRMYVFNVEEHMLPGNSKCLPADKIIYTERDDGSKVDQYGREWVMRGTTMMLRT